MVCVDRATSFERDRNTEESEMNRCSTTTSACNVHMPLCATDRGNTQPTTITAAELPTSEGKRSRSVVGWDTEHFLSCDSRVSFLYVQRQRTTNIMHLRHAIVAAWIAGTHAFHFLPSQKINSFVTHIGAKSKPKTPEYIVEDGDVSGEVPRRAPKSDGKASEIRLTSPPNPLQEYVQANYNAPTKEDKSKPNLQYAALPPGTVVQIQVGDIGLARKAWKKRRRSGSPLLVPCSVLNVDRASTVRWNLIYLLEKFGRSAGSKGGVRASMADLAKRYRSHLKTSLAKQATSLGFDSPKPLVQALFNERVQKSYGIDMIEDEAGELFLQAPVSRLRAQKRANRSPVLQVEDDLVEDTLKHTGVVRTRRGENVDEKDNLYHLQPLSAALRVSQKEDVDGGNIQTGSLHTAVVFEFDAAGDAGAPLITLSLNSSPRERLKFGNDGNNRDTIRRPTYMFNDLKIGDGPIKGKVVRFIKGGALIDCGIGRPAGQRPESDTVRVLGLLKFNEAVVEESGSATQIGWSDDTTMADEEDDEDWKDIFSFEDLELSEEDLVDEDDDDDDEEEEATLAELEEDPDLATLFNFDDGEDGEEVEDITHLFTTEADGSLTYHDPETGEVQHFSADSLDDDEDEEEGDKDDLVDVFGESDSDDSDEDEDDGPIVLNQPSHNSSPKLPGGKVRSKRLHLNDDVEVYVRSVAKQSNQVFLTMRASIKGKKPKDIKQESGKEKKLGRLLKQVGGMGRIRELHGREMDGIVKATSHTGDWLYVEPLEAGLPVGIAYGKNGSLDGVSKGDTIRIQLDGIDEDRGQLSMRVLNKVSP
eukprot:scaffold710_cov171-Amphora_coffeaeformis.AAC.42